VDQGIEGRQAEPGGRLHLAGIVGSVVQGQVRSCEDGAGRDTGVRELAGAHSPRDHLSEPTPLGVLQQEDRLSTGDEDQVGISQSGADVSGIGAFQIEGRHGQTARGENGTRHVHPGRRREWVAGGGNEDDPARAVGQFVKPAGERTETLTAQEDMHALNVATGPHPDGRGPAGTT
jgi:hypothetical protein